MTQAKEISATRAVATSIIVSLSDVLLNTLIALLTGSVVMLSQALQGLADLTTAIFLMIGVRRSKYKANDEYPLGYGREVFFWTLIASMFAFFVTGGLAIWRGIQQMINPGEIEYVLAAFGMLTFGLIGNGYSVSVSLKRLTQKSKNTNLLRFINRSSLVETKTSLIVDLMGVTSAFLGLIALGLYQITGNAVFDGIGAASVGVLTAAAALFIIFNLKGFIVGQSTSPETIERIESIALSIKDVNDVLDLRAVTVGSGEILVILEVHFKDDLSTDDIERITDRIKHKIIKEIAVVKSVHVEAETPDGELLSKEGTSKK